MLFSRTTTGFAAILFLVSAAACGHGGGAMLPSQGSGETALSRIAPQKEYSILKMLKKQVVRNVDKGASGALFGIVTTGDQAKNQKVYFNDDNDNNLQVLER